MSIGLGQMLIGGLLGSQLFGGKDKEQQPQMNSTNQQQPTQVASNNTQQGQGGGFGGIISGFSNSLFKGMSQEQVARLGQGFNSMRLRPDQGMHDAFQNTIKNAQNKINTNATVIELRKMGKPNLARMVEIGAMPVDTALSLAFKEGKGTTDIKSMIAWLTNESSNKGREHFAEYAEILTSNPSMLDEISKNVMNDLGFGDTNLARTYSAPKVMQEGEHVGEEYIIVRDPNKIGSDQITIEYTGAIFPTEIEKEEARVAAEVLANDEQKARDYGALAFQEAQAMDSTIYNYEEALKEFIYIDENGIEQFRDDKARTGWIANQLPAMRKSTAKLRTIANKMGISVINMATFGALSEREMQMAMATNLNLQLPPAELRKMILEQIRVRRKLAMEFNDRALMLLTEGDGRYSTFAVNMAKRQIKHNAVIWEKLRPEEIASSEAGYWIRSELEVRYFFQPSEG